MIWMAADGSSGAARAGGEDRRTRAVPAEPDPTRAALPQAELLGLAHRLLPPFTGAANSSRLEIGAPAPFAGQPAPLGVMSSPAALSPTIARLLAVEGEGVPARPLTLLDRFASTPSVTPAPGPGPATLVFARARRKALPAVPAPVSPRPGPPAAPLSALDTGRPLPAEDRRTMEPVIGASLSEVRIHTGPQANALASMLRAEAFTIGRDVFFGHGRYDPMTPRGRALLAHELVHVRQQTAIGERIQRYGDTPDGAEAEAEAVEQGILAAAEDRGHQLQIDALVPHYLRADGSRISNSERTRLDAILARAIEIGEEILGPALSRHAGRELSQVEVKVSLDLTLQSDDQAAEIWGRALADRIQRDLG